MSFLTLRPLLILALIALPCGCRRATPPSFAPGPAVEELTAEVEDAEEREVLEELQSQIAVKMRQVTGTPEKLILLGTEKTSDKLKLGYAVYSNYCTQCHGVNGDGNGPVAEHLNPKPRNYTMGVFKFTSTPYGSKPRRSDLMKTIQRGVTGTSMPSFDRFSPEQLEAVVDYVLALTYRGQLESELAAIAYDEEELPDEEYLADVVAGILEPWSEASGQIVMPASPMPPMTPETIAAGHEIFLTKACNKCHGKYGRGGLAGGVDVGTDVWGHNAAAADLSSGMFRGGDRFVDIYRRITSGINGTPMPAFASMFEDDPDAIWHLVHFVKETGNRRRQGKPPLSEADLPTELPSVEQASEDDAEADVEEDAREGESEPSEDVQKKAA
ncbi:c-type cytochrome [Adhaeretor mobilis]|uniref:c-type cytochrome n=1 Tax=Adhaeretor mobilis TaxID=1930276 RepID=UPI001C54F15E|nr:cytochrome c [Adhaeretor mobilis]